MKMKRRGILAFIMAWVLLCGNVLDIKAAEGTLKVGVRSDIVNYSYYDKSNKQYYGFEIDLANQLAEDLGYSDVEFVRVKPSNRKEKLLNGDVDCVIASYSISDTRKKSLDFSPAYYTDQTKIMVEKSSMIDEVSDLNGKNIGILDGTNAGPLLATKLFNEGLISSIVEDNDSYTQYDHVRVTHFKSYAQVSDALETGDIDAACMDGVIAQMYKDDTRDYLNIDIADQQYGVATKKGSSLSKPIAKKIKKYLKDGTIDTLKDKWD